MEQFNSFTVPIKKEKMESLTAIIIANKKFHPLHAYQKTTMIEYHVNQLMSIYKNIDIVYIGGMESYEVKCKIPTIKVIENADFTNTNDTSNIRLGMLYNTNDNVLLMKCGAAVNNILMNNIIQHNKNSTVAIKTPHKEIGVTVVDNKIEFIAFGLEYQWVPICLFNKKQISEFAKVVYDSNVKKMFHELINTHIKSFEMSAII